MRVRHLLQDQQLRSTAMALSCLRSVAALRPLAAPPGRDMHGGGVPFGNLPFGGRKRYPFTLGFTLFFASAFSLPYLLLRFHLQKKSGQLARDEEGVFLQYARAALRKVKDWVSDEEEEGGPCSQDPCTCDKD